MLVLSLQALHIHHAGLHLQWGGVHFVWPLGGWLQGDVWQHEPATCYVGHLVGHGVEGGQVERLRVGA